MFAKFCNAYKRLNCKLILINISFNIQEIKFFGLIISTKGIQMDLQKVQTILD